jgi:proteasome lid subunit RPN8/RPN11
MIPAAALKEIQILAAKSPQREVCGLIDSTGRVYPILNTALQNNHFQMSKQEYGLAVNTIKAAGNSITCVYHSHINGDATPSAADRLSQQALKIPYLIIAGTTAFWLGSDHAKK